MQDAVDRLHITELIQNWGFWRDQGRWDLLRSTFHPEGTIKVTWFDGAFADFVDSSIEMKRRRVSQSKHWIGGTTVEIVRSRAVAQTNVMICGRRTLHGMAVDSVSHGRFHDQLERRDQRWRILHRVAIYEKDRLDPVQPGASIPLDPALLNRFPEAYRHLGYALAQTGYDAALDLPTDGSDSLRQLEERSTAWLNAQ